MQCIDNHQYQKRIIKMKGFHKTDFPRHSSDNLKGLCWALRSVDAQVPGQKTLTSREIFPLRIHFDALLLNIHVHMCANKIMGPVELIPSQTPLSVIVCSQWHMIGGMGSH